MLLWLEVAELNGLFYGGLVGCFAAILWPLLHSAVVGCADLAWDFVTKSDVKGFHVRSGSHCCRVALSLECLPGNLGKEEVREVYEKRRVIRPTCSTTSLHSCLVAGRHFLVFTLAHSSSSTNLVTGTWTRPHTSWGAVLQTCRATVLSLHTCTHGHTVTGLQGVTG